MMDIGFNLIEKSHPEIFEEKIGIIEFLRRIMKGEKLSYNLAVIGLDTLLYYAEDEEGISRHVRNILQDHANSFVAGNYIIQIIIEGNLYVVESSERPRVKYREEELLLYPIFGRVKQVDVKHFFAPLNLVS
jgi:hypothetical protein